MYLADWAYAELKYCKQTPTSLTTPVCQVLLQRTLRIYTILHVDVHHSDPMEHGSVPLTAPILPLSPPLSVLLSLNFTKRGMEMTLYDAL